MGGYLTKFRGAQPAEAVVKAEEAKELPADDAVNDQSASVKGEAVDELVGGGEGAHRLNGHDGTTEVSTTNGAPGKDDDGDATEEDELASPGDVDKAQGEYNGVASVNGFDNGHNGHSGLSEITNGNGHHHNGAGDGPHNVVGLGAFEYEESIDDSESGHDLRHETASQASVSERSDVSGDTRRSASKSREYACERSDCGFVCKFKKQLKQHEKDHRAMQNEIAKRQKIQDSLPENSSYNPDMERPFICIQSGCDWSFKQLSHLKRHAASHASHSEATPAKRPMTYANVLASNEAISPQQPILE